MVRFVLNAGHSFCNSINDLIKFNLIYVCNKNYFSSRYNKNISKKLGFFKAYSEILVNNDSRIVRFFYDKKKSNVATIRSRLW
jgi:hypothetical protein